MSQNRCQKWLGAAAIALLLIGASVAYYLWTHCPIRYDNFEHVANGMHLSEVESLLGCPPGDYCRRTMELQIENLDFPIDNEETRWQGDQGDLMIFHDHNKIVVGKLWIKGEPEPWVKTAMIWVLEQTAAR